MAVRGAHGEHSCCPAAWFNEVLKAWGWGCCPLVTMETEVLRAGVSSIKIKRNQLMARHLGRRGPRPGGRSTGYLGSSRTDLTLSRIYSEHIVLPYKLCQPRGFTFEDFKIRSLKRFCSFRSQLIGDLLFCIKRKKQYTINLAPPPSNLGN